MQNIPLIDIEREYKTQKSRIDTAVLRVLGSGRYVMGDEVKAFEEEFARYTGVRHAVAVGSGTDALTITLAAMGIGAGDEVITTPFTFFATAESIAAVGATPVFADVDASTLNIDVSEIENKITGRTKAIMPVHIFGRCSDMNGINAAAKNAGIKVVEDACQAVGAEYNGKRAGSLGDAGCFSFFPTKNVGCAGDGGMITTNDDELALMCRAIRNHGSGAEGARAAKLDTAENADKYHNYIVGCNSRLDEIQAAVLKVKLEAYPKALGSRLNAVRLYRRLLADIKGIELPPDDEGCVYHMLTLQSDKRDKTVEALRLRGIAAGVYYSVPLHLQRAFHCLGYKQGDLKNAERAAQRVFSLPLFASITADEQHSVAAALKEIEND